MRRHLLIIIVLMLSSGGGLIPLSAEGARAPIPLKVGEPYRGAIVVNADDGEVVFEDKADLDFYPASIVKLMMLLIVSEKLEEKAISLSDPVRVTASAARTGGSQVYLAEHEVFPLEDLLYALIIQSANDAAVALAIQLAGSDEAFVGMMQQRAVELGLKNTEFNSVHGLPPAPGQEPDVSTPRDVARLALELLRHPDILRYTSSQFRTFRNGSFEMRSHNRLLGTFEGCDGLKTGYFKAGGYSIVASARRGPRRFLAVVAGSKKREVRDRKVRELLTQAFASHPSIPPSGKPPVISPDRPSPGGEEDVPLAAPPPPKKVFSLRLGPARLALILIGVSAFFYWLGRRHRRRG